METLTIIISCILSGLFGWWLADIAIVANRIKDELGHNLRGLEVWKVWALEMIFIAVLFLNTFTVHLDYKERVYNTKDYAIETVDTTIEADSTEVTTFKIVKK